MNFIKNFSKDELLIKNIIINRNNESHISDVNFHQIERLLSEKKEVAIFINAEELVMENIMIKNVSFQILKYNSIFDFNVIFMLKDFRKNRNKKGVIELAKWAKLISNAIQAKNYYAGLEPAIDRDTRIFDKEKIGPLNIL